MNKSNEETSDPDNTKRTESIDYVTEKGKEIATAVAEKGKIMAEEARESIADVIIPDAGVGESEKSKAESVDNSPGILEVGSNYISSAATAISEMLGMGKKCTNKDCKCQGCGAAGHEVKKCTDKDCKCTDCHCGKE